MFFRKKNQLELYREYEYHGDYSISNKIKKTSIKDIQGRLEKNSNSVLSIFVNSRFNGLYYPMFDLDQNSKLNLFQQINKDIPYVIFQSSIGHYWGILDTPKKKLSDILDKDPSWKICNDSDYVSFSIQKQNIMDALAINMLPENRAYKYDFFMDNCATRLRDIIEHNIT